MGRNTSVGSGAPCCMRYMKMVTGSSVSDDALSTKNRICALVAVSGCGFSSCSARMAFRPMGVAALSSPSALAAKFSVIRPRAGWPRGTPGMSRVNSGASQRARAFTMPAFSAMRKKPSHSVSVPKSSTITSTDSLAMENRASTMAAKIWALSPTSHWDSAAMAAVTKKPSQRVLSKEETPCGWWSESVRWRPLVSIVQMGPLQRGGAALASALSNWRRGGQSAG